eukprot:6208041-Prymnesium_polylepis.1
MQAEAASFNELARTLALARMTARRALNRWARRSARAARRTRSPRVARGDGRGCRSLIAREVVGGEVSARVRWARPRRQRGGHHVARLR